MDPFTKRGDPYHRGLGTVNSVTRRGHAVHKERTHFEQIPVDVVKRVAKTEAFSGSSRQPRRGPGYIVALPRFRQPRTALTLVPKRLG